LIAAVIYLAIGTNKKKRLAREILDRCHANGEIDTREYRGRLKALESSEREEKVHQDETP
jgi:hypothetical protein